MNRSLKILVSINLVFVFGAALLGPLYAIFVKNIGGNILDIGWTFSVYMITIGVMAYIGGRLGDKIKESEYLVAAGYFIRAIGFFSYTLIASPGQLLILQFFLGIGEAIANPAFKSIYSLHLDSNKSSTQWGVWESLFSITVGIATLAGAFIAQYFGFNVLFYAMSSLAFAAFILLMIQPRKLL
ncbi:MAG: MFS transporter [Patescibacteria group bacterium]|nr:MFS transporter [Patescibacteria group bacterium]MDD5294857.1 MFS transporter [Patescibacteria group bacterium]MDD5554745.1 MFS transporter [Patescibacteria group bacterium]